MHQSEIAKFKTIQNDLISLINSFPATSRQTKLFGQWSLKDILAHLSHWMTHDINCLQDLKAGKEPYWAPNVDDFNRQGVEERARKAWPEIYQEFLNLSTELTKLYETLPEDLWDKPFWQDKDLTPQKFLAEDIAHWRDEHLEELQKKLMDINQNK